MTQVWFCSDLHFGHKNIPKFRNHVSSEEDNRAKIVHDWKTLVGKRDDVWVLGDVAFTMDTIEEFANLPGQRKFMIRGNHDELDTQVYLKYFNAVYGFVKYKEFWLSHAPIHPDELRGKVNLHGHVHYESIRKPFNPAYDIKQELDPRYFNLCVENVFRLKGRSLIELEEIREIVNEGRVL